MSVACAPGSMGNQIAGVRLRDCRRPSASSSCRDPLQPSPLVVNVEPRSGLVFRENDAVPRRHLRRGAPTRRPCTTRSMPSSLRCPRRRVALELVRADSRDTIRICSRDRSRRTRAGHDRAADRSARVGPRLIPPARNAPLQRVVDVVARAVAGGVEEHLARGCRPTWARVHRRPAGLVLTEALTRASPLPEVVRVVVATTLPLNAAATVAIDRHAAFVIRCRAR